MLETILPPAASNENQETGLAGCLFKILQVHYKSIIWEIHCEAGDEM